jgi:hypothetical protein
LPIGNRGSGSSTAQPLNPQASSKSWRDVLPVHPAAELFPLMSESELKELGEDIKKNGLTSPIVLWQADPKEREQLLDGRNRLDAIESVTGKPVEIGAPSLMAGDDFLALNRVITLDKSVEPYAYVISANYHRRHLDAEGKRKAIEALLKATPEKSNRQIAETVKASHVTVGAVRTEMESTGQIDQLMATTGKDGKTRTTRSRQPPARASHPASAASAPAGLNDVLPPTDVEPGPRRTEPRRTPALLKGQEDRVIDEQFPETRRAIERLVQYAASCNRAAEVIRELRALLDQLEVEGVCRTAEGAN